MAVLAVVSSPARAQGFGRVANTPYNAGVSVINPPSVMKMDLMNQLKDAWRSHRSIMSAAATAYFNGRDLGGNIVTTGNQVRISDNGRLYIGADSRGFTVRFAVANNTMSTALRTPNRPRNGVYPQFTVSFDMDISIDVDVSGNQLVASPARIRTTVGQPAGNTANGVFAVAAGNLARMLSSPEFAFALLSTVNAGPYSPPREITATLTQMNPILQQATRGGSLTTGYDGATGNVSITIHRPGASPFH